MRNQLLHFEGFQRYFAFEEFQRYFAMDGQDFRNVPVYRGAVKVSMQKTPATKKSHFLVGFSLRISFFPSRLVSLIGQALYVMLESLLLVGQIFN